MPKVTLYSLNASGGALTNIPATIPCRRVEVREDESVTVQGLIYQTINDSFVGTYQCGTPGSPDQPQITMGNVVGNLKGAGPLIGLPAQAAASGGSSGAAATVLLKIKSAGAGTTKVRVVEHE